MTALKLPRLPFALEPEGSPPPGCRVRSGVLTLTAAAGTDLFVDPAGAEQVPDAGRFTGLPPAGDFTLAAQVSVEFASMYDAGVLLLPRPNGTGPSLLRSRAAHAHRGHGGDQGDVGRLPNSSRWTATRCASDHAVRGGLGVPRLGRRSWWRLLRYFTLGKDLVRVGFLAQSPAGEGCAATFDHITFRAGAPENLRDGS